MTLTSTRSALDVHVDVTLELGAVLNREACRLDVADHARARRDDDPDDMRVAKFLRDIAIIQLKLGLLRDIEITDRLTGESSKIKFEIDVVP